MSLNFNGQRSFRNTVYLILIFAIVLGYNNLSAQTNETMSAGSYIINMGVQPQIKSNALRPYGLVYELVKYHFVPIRWVINGSKAKDGTDFTYNGYNYIGGPFIIPAEYMTPEVISEIASWTALGVVGTTTTSPITVPVHTILQRMPRWTLDDQNGYIAEGYIENALIPQQDAVTLRYNYNWEDPQLLNCCNDIFAMPHADPTWATHSNLYDWNLNCKGAIWMACHAGSALELMFNPANPSTQTNFLTKKTAVAQGGGPYASPSNSLTHWGDHDNGTLPYTYAYPADPFMQFIGIIDQALKNGSEQIYIPVADSPSLNNAGWNPGAKIYVYDPNHPDARPATGTPMDQVAANVVSGRGFDNPDRGRVMLESSHSHSKSSSPSNIAAQRIFFNFSFFTANEKAITPSLSGIPNHIFSGVPQPISFSLPAGANLADYNVSWASTCGGSFSPNNTVRPNGSLSTTFTPPTVLVETTCFISVQIEDACNRIFTDNDPAIVTCEVDFTATSTKPICNGGTNGVINLNVTTGVAPYTFSWVRTPSGSGSGAGTQITGLLAGTYAITVIDNGGTGCTGELTVSLSEPAALSAIGTTTNPFCPGDASGSIDLTVSGGTAPYSFNWGGGITTEDRSNIQAGSYSVTVTDANSCTAIAPFSLSDPSAVSISPTTTDILCYGESTGTISLSMSGGNAPYTYLWSDGNSDQNRTELSIGDYTVTVTDSYGCTDTTTETVGQPTAALSATATITNVICSGIPTGAIDLSPAGGTVASGYSYLWSNAATTQDLTNVDAGNYTVTITDDNSCTLIKEYTVAETDPIQLSLVGTNATCPSDQNGAITLTVSGGAPTYTFDWTYTGNGLDDPDVDPQNLTGLDPDNYTVIVTDQNECTATISATVGFNNPDPVVPNLINH